MDAGGFHRVSDGVNRRAAVPVAAAAAKSMSAPDMNASDRVAANVGMSSLLPLSRWRAPAAGNSVGRALFGRDAHG